MLEKIKIEARKKAKRSKESKWNGKNTTQHTAQHTWWGNKTWPQNPEPLPVSDGCFAPGAWIPSGGWEYWPAPWEYYWTPPWGVDPRSVLPQVQEDYNQGMNPKEAKELSFKEAVDMSMCLHHCPKAAGPKRMPVKKSTPPLLQPPPPPPPPSRPPPLPQPPLSLTPARLSTPPRSQKRKAGGLTGRRKQCNPRSAPPSPPSPISVSSPNSAPARSPRKKNNLDGRLPAPPEALSPRSSPIARSSPTEMPVPTELPTPSEDTVCKTPRVAIRDKCPDASSTSTGISDSECEWGKAASQTPVSKTSLGIVQENSPDTPSSSSNADSDCESGKVVSQTPECPNNHPGETDSDTASHTSITLRRDYSPSQHNSPSYHFSKESPLHEDASSSEASRAKESGSFQ